jgi:hypothetical protein
MGRVAHIVAATVLLTLGGAAAAHVAFAKPETGFVAGSHRIAFVTDDGRRMEAPEIAVAGAYPGMHANDSIVRLENEGTLAETFTLAATTAASASHSLDDVLRVTVLDRSTGSVVYAGRISELSFRGASTLAPDQTAEFVVQISWPETGRNDSAYQGQTIGFSLVAAAHPAA